MFFSSSIYGSISWQKTRAEIPYNCFDETNAKNYCMVFDRYVLYRDGAFRRQIRLRSKYQLGKKANHDFGDGDICQRFKFELSFLQKRN